MNAEAKKERELRKSHVKHRMEYYPLPLKWFKFFRYVSMVLNIVNCISGIISYIIIAVVMSAPEATERIREVYPDFNVGMFTAVAVADFLVTVYLLVLCVLVFIRMGTLSVSGYNLIIIFLISLPLVTGIRQFISGWLNMTMHAQLNSIGSIAVAAISITAFSGVVSLLNYIYFRKRKTLFTDHPEIDDFEIDNGSVQLQHYDECPFCHQKINGNSSFCEHCGRNFTEPADNGEDNSRKE